MKRVLGVATLLMLNSNFAAQTNDEQWKEHINALKEKSDKFNVYLNTQTAFEATNNNTNKDFESGFKINQLRLEFRGNLTDKIFYRLRHRLNRNSSPSTQDNVSSATDFMYVGVKLSNKLAITGGKMGQYWGGFEYDENPIYIYEYSDFIENISSFMVGGLLTYTPNDRHEFHLNITNSRNNKLESIYENSGIKKSNSPLAYIFNWNGNFFKNKLQTRWAIGYQQEAKNYGITMITLGTKLNLHKIQMYFDYMRSDEDLDRMQYAKAIGSNEILKNVVYDSFIYQATYQPNKKWNLFVKGTYETTKIGKLPIKALDSKRKSFGYSAGIEYIPFDNQDLRLFLTYIGRKFDYKYDDNLDNTTNRFMLGMIYRIKAF